MRVAVVSCWKYRDAWPPFSALYKQFFPLGPTPQFFSDDNELTWGQVAVNAAGQTEETVLILQEDFFLNSPVNFDLVQRGLAILTVRPNVGAVRLYPCPGATETSNDTYFGQVARHSAYRTSCQATIWKPAYLKAIAERYNTPAEFELQGSPWASENLPQEVWAFKREVQPWPISYFCSAISRGKWEPAALEFCRQQGITVDTSLRPVA